MIVISKKRIQIIRGCLLIGIFTFYFQIAGKGSTHTEQQNTVPTAATPVSGKTIVIDAGHGVPDERCTK